MKRRFIDAPSDVRCEWTITLSDGSKAQCGRHKKHGNLCTQHLRMYESMRCEYCGSNDELPPECCQDCERPTP